MLDNRRVWCVAFAFAAMSLALACEPAVAKKPPKPPSDDGGASAISFHELGLGLKTMDEHGASESLVMLDPNIYWYDGQWSPDGLRLGGSQKWIGEGPYDKAVISIRADGTDERVIVSYADIDLYNFSIGRPSVFEAQPAFVNIDDGSWSPDGRFWVLSADAVYRITNDDGTTDYRYPSHLYIVDTSDPDAPVAERITQLGPELLPGADGDKDPHWSPTLNKIVFESDRGGSLGLWVINPDGSGLRRIMDLDFGRTPYMVKWSHGGDVQDPTDPDDGAASLFLYAEGVGGMLLDIDLSREDPIVGIVPGIGGPYFGWSPDDSRLVFTRIFDDRRFTFWQIVVVDISTSQETVLREGKVRFGTSEGRIRACDWNPVPPLPQ